MTIRTVYLALAVLGTIVPFSQLLPWVGEHGLDVPLLVAELFSTRIGAFFGLDVIVSAVVVMVFAFYEASQRRLRRVWLPVAATCLIGVSCGLPLLLYQRESRRD